MQLIHNRSHERAQAEHANPNPETKLDAANNWIAMRMLLSSYNRGINKIALTILRNWMLQFSKLFCDPDPNSKMLGEREVDSTFKTAKKRELIFEKMQHSLLQIFNFMQRQGLLPKAFRMLYFLDCIRLISRSETRIEFIKHPLIRFWKEYFENTTRTHLSVVLSEEQMQSYYFSYGGKVLRSQNDFVNLSLRESNLCLLDAWCIRVMHLKDAYKRLIS